MKPIDETVYNWIVGIFGYNMERWLIMYIIGMNDREVDYVNLRRKISSE